MPPHRVYIEPCMGSAEVFFRKKPAEKEILNDYNGDLVNFFRILQDGDKLAFLLGRLCLSWSSEYVFQRNRSILAAEPNVLDEALTTAKIIRKASWRDVRLAAAFLENQVYSFSSTGQSFAIAKRDMTHRLPRLLAAAARLRDAVILHRDYKEAIRIGACEDCFILLDPPYRGTERMYRKTDFDPEEHEKLFAFMSQIHKEYAGKCKFLITYNNDPYIRSLSEKYHFFSYVQRRIHNMQQVTAPGALFEELLIGNYDLVAQARENHRQLAEEKRQLSLFDLEE